MSTSRHSAFRQFLTESGWTDADVHTLAGDASNRRYLRLAHCGKRAIVMDVTGEAEALGPFVAMTEWLRDQGYSAPAILEADYSRGYLLLEDLGDDLYSDWIRRRAADETMLYARAVDLLADLADRPVPPTIGRGPSEMPVPPYDLAALEREALLMSDWWMPAASGGTIERSLCQEYRGLIGEAVSGLADCRRILVLRDYHADNLIWLHERPGLAAVGLLDYQDVLVGHPSYDLVSLLEDARRDTPSELREAMIERYLSLCPDEDGEAFRRAYCVLGAQRNLKIVGIFARLAVRDRKPRYLQMIPRAWGHLVNDLRHPALARLGAWVHRHVPAPEQAVLARIAAEVAR